MLHFVVFCAIIGKVENYSNKSDGNFLLKGDRAMDIFSIISLLGGLALFLYGMNIMSEGLEKSSTGALNKNLKVVTKNRFLAMIFGAGLTIAVQSSSAVTVMLVGLVNSGILEFGQTIGVLMGSNIGTTLTAWILSLAGLDGGDIWWINILKPANFSPLFAFTIIMPSSSVPVIT